jgi:hypothetical protein
MEKYFYGSIDKNSNKMYIVNNLLYLTSQNTQGAHEKKNTILHGLPELDFNSFGVLTS